jgi:hypothetical protein
MPASACAMRVGDAGVAQRPGDQRAEAPGEGVAIAEPAQCAGRLRGQAQRDLGVAVGECHADARGRGGELALGLADVGAAAQQRGAVADRDGTARPGGVLQPARSAGKPRGGWPVSVAGRYGAPCRTACNGGSAACSCCRCCS